MLQYVSGVNCLACAGVARAAEALRLMENEKFSLYVIDGQMPNVGGFTFCEEIRRVDKVTPIVFFTGKGFEADREAGMLAGANAYIVKPDAREIIPTVRRLLEEARGGAGANLKN
jgi:DNA-binding response OmpR family regulator